MNGTHFHNPAGLDEPPRSLRAAATTRPLRHGAPLARGDGERDRARDRRGGPVPDDPAVRDARRLRVRALGVREHLRRGPEQRHPAGQRHQGGRDGEREAHGALLGERAGAGRRASPAPSAPIRPRAGAAYIDDAAHLLELGAAECGFDFTYVGATFEATWFNEFSPGSGLPRGRLQRDVSRGAGRHGRLLPFLPHRRRRSSGRAVRGVRRGGGLDPLPRARPSWGRRRSARTATSGSRITGARRRSSG